MKRRTWRKKARRRHLDAVTYLRRQSDKHDRWYLLAFMRRSIEVLAVPGDVNAKVIEVAALARRLAPAIAAEKRSNG